MRTRRAPDPDPTDSRTASLDRLREIRLRLAAACPRCAGERVQRWGRFSGRQRYRCLGCGRTYSDFTGTPLAYLKRIDRWEAYCDLALAGSTVRAAAARLGLDPGTCFRWRHRLLASLRASETTELSGRTSLALTWTPHSEKGSRNLDRPARRRRFEGGSAEIRAVWVVMACDAEGRSIGAVAGPRPPGRARLVTILRDRVRPGATLLSRRGELSPDAAAARALGLRFEREAVLDRLAVRARPEAGRTHALRWKRWMRRFNGVATRYLEHYLVWFRLADVAAGRSVPEGRLEIMRMGHFP